MPVFAPHGPVYEETEFWYDTKENALLYEVCITTGLGEAEADHRRVREGGRLTDREWVHHDHYEPHGIAFEDPELDEPQRVANIDNTELVIRLWCQIESGEQPMRTRFREPLIPIPKALALFLAAKRREMHREESVTQALLLLHSHVASKETLKCP